MKGSDGFSVGGSGSFVLRVQHPLFSVSLGRRVETATLGFKARNLSLSEHEHVGQEKVSDVRFLRLAFLPGALNYEYRATKLNYIPRGSYPTPFFGYLVLWLGSVI